MRRFRKLFCNDFSLRKCPLFQKIQATVLHHFAALIFSLKILPFK